MQVHVKRLTLAAGLVLTFMLTTMPLSQASTTPPGPPPSAMHQTYPDLSTADAIAAYFTAHPATNADAEAIKANITMTKDGYFATTSSQFKSDVAATNAGLKQFKTANPTQQAIGTINAQAGWWGCWVYIPGWAFHAYIYYIVISGGVFAIVGVFASLTVIGIPLGAILAVLGISYGLYAFMLDAYFSQRGFYNSGAWLCI